ncbi:MAG: FAD synthetase family protein [Anaerolineae bacterium]|nr:FAD synthetase family protein [Anaerolineae bacterium]
MHITYSLSDVNLVSPSSVTVGVFDGIHRGHQQLLRGLVNAARVARFTAVVITFDPHPAAVLGHPAPPLLTSIQERAELMTPLGLDLLVVLTFTPELARTTVTDFIALLQRHLHLAQLWGGPDLALGYRREGDIPFLRRLGAEVGFTVHIVEPLVWEGDVVTSSRVRAALRAGDVRQAAGCLGRPYRLPGTVMAMESGANGALFTFMPSPGRLIPARGRYECLVRLGGEVLTPATVLVREEILEVSVTRLSDDHLPGDRHSSWALDFISKLG